MQITKLIMWLIICQIPALAGMGAVRSNMAWYHSLNQPVFAPPDWVFTAVWMILYILLGIVGYLIVRDGITRQSRPTLVLFVGQLALNACWTPIFFGQQEIGLALVWLSMMIFVTAWLMKRLWAPQHQAFWLMVPYGLWLCFAWCLNYAVLLLN
ncbi:MAG: tryptophan-rich sensory protein [Elusimicrobiaceae bacterium]|nr:tryptophan-rich sensory protein [Elusimicrobiaceae bacterium]